MKLSERARKLKQSEPRRIYDAAQQYRDVIDLTLGDPDLPPPPNVRDAACRAIAAGKTRYSANAGLFELRRAIAAEAEREYGLKFDPATEIIVTVGANFRPYSRSASIAIARRSSINPALALYRVLPAAIARQAASRTFAGGGRSGSPSVRSMTSRYCCAAS